MIRRRKFGNVRVVGYASKREHRRGAQLALLQEAGQIRGLKWQVRFELIPKQSGERACHYVADFVYEENGVKVVEDCKGMRTPLYVVKRKLMLFVHGIKIRES